MSEYGANQIKVVEGLDAVRERPGMYIGSTNVNGLHHLLYEVLDNSVDEAMAGHANEIKVVLNPDGSATVEDNGRGIPVEPMTDGPFKGVPTVQVVMTTLHAGGKFDSDAYKVSGGLHGVGISVVNALSTWTEATVKRDGKFHTIKFGYVEQKRYGKNVMVSGAVTDELRSYGRIPKSETGTLITFMPDPSIFSTTVWDWKTLELRIMFAAFLNPGVKFSLLDNRDPEDQRFSEYHAENGLLDLIDVVSKPRIEKIAERLDIPTEDVVPVCPPFSLSGRDDSINSEWEVVLQWVPDGVYNNHYSFANGIHTKNGGTHVKGFESVLTKQINRYARQDHIALLTERDPNLEALDVRSGLQAIVSIKTPNPRFSGQTKDELDNDEVQVMVRTGFAEQFAHWMEENSAEIKAIISKAVSEMRIRKKAQDAADSERNKQAAKGISAGTMKLPPKLADCSSHVDAELFIVEGDSAAGPAVRRRNGKFQAVLPIRGKGLNIEKALSERNGGDKIENNAEVQGIIATIGAGSRDFFDLSKARFNKVIILTDADDDGRHIQLLLMTFFYRLMPDFVRDGRLYVARPPLFMTTTKVDGEYKFFADEKSRNEWLEANDNPKVEFRRFKGLGEMSSPQLGLTTIDRETRLISQIVIDDDSVADKTITELMGGNADIKWEYLQDVAVRVSEV